MAGLPNAIKSLAKELSRLPSIGPRQATRLAIYLARNKDMSTPLSQAIEGLVSIKQCKLCFYIHQNDGELCDICANDRRDYKKIMIVEKETDLISVEATGKYLGVYLITGEMPRSGLVTDTTKKRLSHFKKRLESNKEKADEIILGFSPTNLGDLQASIIKKEVSQLAKKISRLGRGLPSGGEIEFADSETLGSALDGRM